MIKNLAYDFHLDTEKGTVKIGLNGSSFVMSFEKAQSISPIFAPSFVSSGKESSIIYQNAYPDIDIIYHLSQDKIKEEIIIKGPRAPSEIEIDLDLNGCMIFLDNESGRKRYVILGRNQIELFEFSDPHVTYKEHNFNVNLDNCVQMEYRETTQKLVYKFNKIVLQGNYPVIIDPTFIFTPRIKHNLPALRDRFSRHNMMYVTGKTWATATPDNFVTQTPVTVFPSVNKQLRAFTSDDVVFERDLRIFFPFFQGVEKITITLNQSGSKNTKFINIDPNDVNDPNVGIQTGSEKYFFIDVRIPSELSRKVNILGIIKMDYATYGNFSIAYERDIYYISNIDMKFSPSNNVFTANKNDDFIGVDLSISHVTNFRPLEYHVIPFVFDSSNDSELDKTITLKGLPTSIENQNPNRTNVRFNFNPNILPEPIFQERESPSSVVDVETLIKSLPGINYDYRDENDVKFITALQALYPGFSSTNKNVAPVKKNYYKIGTVGNWEFWLVFYKFNYPVSPTTISFTDIRPFIFIKNNRRFTDSVIIVSTPGVLSFRMDWEPGQEGQIVFSELSSLDSEEYLPEYDFWRQFTDNTENSTVETKEFDYFQKIVEKYFITNEDTLPIVPTGTGFETNFIYRHRFIKGKTRQGDPIQENTEKFLDLKMRYDVKGDDFFDITFEVTNTGDRDVSRVVMISGIVPMYANNLFNFSPGMSNKELEKRIKSSLFYKNNDEISLDTSWIPKNSSNVTATDDFPSDIWSRDFPYEDLTNILYVPVKNRAGDILSIRPGNWINNSGFDVYYENRTNGAYDATKKDTFYKYKIKSAPNGSSTVVVKQQSIADTPAKGIIRLFNRETLSYDPYFYSSFSGDTFNLVGTLSRKYASQDPCRHDNKIISTEPLAKRTTNGPPTGEEVSSARRFSFIDDLVHTDGNNPQVFRKRGANGTIEYKELEQSFTVGRKIQLLRNADTVNEKIISEGEIIEISVTNSTTGILTLKNIGGTFNTSNVDDIIRETTGITIGKAKPNGNDHETITNNYMRLSKTNETTAWPWVGKVTPIPDDLKKHRFYFEFKVRTNGQVEETGRITMGYNVEDKTIVSGIRGRERPPTLGPSGVFNYFFVVTPEWKTFSGYMDWSDIEEIYNEKSVDGFLKFIIRPFQRDSEGEVHIDDLVFVPIKKTFSTPPTDPKQDPRYEIAMADPRWHSGNRKFGSVHWQNQDWINATKSGRNIASVLNNVFVFNPGSDTEWPYLFPNARNDRWTMDRKLEPFFAMEHSRPSFETKAEVFAVTTQHPWSMRNTFNNLGGTATEIGSDFFPMPSIPLVRSKESASTKIRFFFDIDNGSRESWYNNVFKPGIDFENVQYTSGGDFSISKSFQNKAEIVVKSAINDRTNIQEGARFQTPYKYIDQNDMFYVLNNDEGIVVPGKISLKDGDFDLFAVQKTNFLYTKEGDKFIRFHENIHTINYSKLFKTFTVGSTLKQENSNATARFVDIDVTKKLIYISGIKGVFNKINKIREIENFNSTKGPSIISPSGDALAVHNNETTMLQLFQSNPNSGGDPEDIKDRIFTQKFDKLYPVEKLENQVVKSLRLGLDVQSLDIFKGGYFSYPNGNTLQTVQILSNTDHTITLMGNVKNLIENIDHFVITLYNPNQINLNFLAPGYTPQNSQLTKFKVTRNGNILFKPVKVSVKENKPTKIEASVRQKGDDFGGISSLVSVAGETLFDVTGITENNVQIYGFVDISDNALPEDTSPSKIPLFIGGANLDTIIVPSEYKKKQLLLRVRTSVEAEQVRAVVNKKDGTTIEFEAQSAITPRDFIITVPQKNLGEYTNIRVLFEPRDGGALDLLGILDVDSGAGGIDLETDVLPRLRSPDTEQLDIVSAIPQFNKFKDKLLFNGYEGIKATDIANSNQYRFAFKKLDNLFNNNAIIHTTSDNYLPNGVLFVPAHQNSSGSTLPAGTPIVAENVWIKTGAENIVNYIQYTDNRDYSTSSRIDLRVIITYYLQKKFNWVFTNIRYVNRGSSIDNLVLMNRIDLYHLRDFIPPDLYLPANASDMLSSYGSRFRANASNQFFFREYLDIGGLVQGPVRGIASPELTGVAEEEEPKAKIYRVKNVEDTSQGLNIENLVSSIGDFAVEKKVIEPNFFLQKIDETGGIKGTLYSKSGQFISTRFNSLGIPVAQHPRPFLGHTALGDSIVYGIGVNTLGTNEGYEYGIILSYADNQTVDDIFR